MNNEITTMNITKGTIYALPEAHIYNFLMPITDKTIAVEKGTIRECVAWNKDRCKRWDTTEEQLNSLAVTGKIKEDLTDYIRKNKNDIWNNAKAPEWE